MLARAAGSQANRCCRPGEERGSQGNQQVISTTGRRCSAATRGPGAPDGIALLLGGGVVVEVSVGVGVGVGVEVSVAVGVGVGVGVPVGVEVGVLVGVAVGVLVGVLVGVTVGLGDPEGPDELVE